MAAKFLNFILSLVVLFSSTGLVLGKHTCQRMAQQPVQAKNCCADHQGCDDNCCQTDFRYFQLDQDQQAPTLGIEVPTCPTAWPASPVFQLRASAPTDRKTLRYLTYHPPIVLRDIPSLFQVFRC